MAQVKVSEHTESVVFAEYLELLAMQGKVIVYSKVPSETFTKSWAAKTRNKQEGVKRGVPDYIVVTSKDVVFIELKVKKGGVVSAYQKQWIGALQDKPCYAAVCKGANEAIEEIKKHL